MPNEDQKLDSLRPGLREMERGCWEGQNVQQLKKVQRLEEEDVNLDIVQIFRCYSPDEYGFEISPTNNLIHKRLSK